VVLQISPGAPAAPLDNGSPNRSVSLLIDPGAQQGLIFKLLSDMREKVVSQYVPHQS
jgi:hypothetical protein